MAAENSALLLLKKKEIVKYITKENLNSFTIHAALVSIPIKNRKTVMIMITILVVCK